MQPDSPCASAAQPDRAAEWARWSLMWSRVTPVIEAEAWFAGLDAHTQAAAREAVTQSCLRLLPDYTGLLKPDFWARRFARRNMPLEQHDAWVARILRTVEKVKVND